MISHHTSILKAIIELTSQLTVIRILYISVGFIGMLLIAQLGKQELAAGALVSALSTTIMVIAMSPLFAIGIIAARHYGEKKFTEMGRLLQQAWMISVAMGVIGSIFFWMLPALLEILHQPPELIPLIRDYFHGLAWGTIPAFLIASCYQIFFPIKKGNLVIMLSILNLILITVLGLILMHGYFGFTKFGMAGWAYSTSFINWVLAMLIFAYLYFCEDFRPFRFFSFANKIDFVSLKTFFNISLPITLQFSGELLAFSMLNIMVGWLGINLLSIQQILTQCSTFALMIPMGSAQACAILIAQAIGRNELGQVKNICYISIAFVVFCMIMIALIYILTPLSLISLYIDTSQAKDASIINLAKTMLALIAFSQIADAIRNVLIGALRGQHDVWWPMWTNVGLLFCMALPGAYLFGFIFGYGLFGLNFAFLIAFTLGAILMFRQFSHKFKVSLKAPVLSKN